jgi:hypothetical protein
VSFIERLMQRVGRDLDRRVVGAEGTAHERFAEIKDDATLLVSARVDGGRGAIELVVQPAESAARTERSDGALSTALEPAQDYRGAMLTFRADVAGGSDLAVLSAELMEPHPEGAERAPLARQSYSVEARFADGRARLELVIDLA